jgi:hypothetical protein
MSEDVMPYGGLKPNEAERTNELRGLLEKLGYSQREGAEALEVDVRTLRYWAAANPAPPLMAIYALRYLAEHGRQRKGDVAAGAMNALGRAHAATAGPNALATMPTQNALARSESSGTVYKTFLAEDDEPGSEGSR